jgi:glycosyltransferase involved in cell wall biosynthesis
MGVLNAYQPDIIMVIQDAPYAEAIRNAPIDWSRFALVVITPVDGAPVYPQWVEMLKACDGTLSISQFGVDTHKQAGIASDLCRPGIETDTFCRLPDDQRAALRQKLGIAPDAFVFGTVAQNQGRKCIPGMMQGFFKFAADKPSARYLMNMDPQSPAGWDLLQLCQMNGWDAGKLIWRADCDHAGVHLMRERYNVMDAHAVLSHREGYGLPLTEAQACGVVSMAIAYCSGQEICGDGYGVIVKHHPFTEVSTWGGALDYFPDYNDLAARLQWLYDHPAERAAIAERGMERARTWTWDVSVDNVANVLERVMDKRRSIAVPTAPLIRLPQAIPPNADGIKTDHMPTVDLPVKAEA